MYKPSQFFGIVKLITVIDYLQKNFICAAWALSEAPAWGVFLVLVI